MTSHWMQLLNTLKLSKLSNEHSRNLCRLNNEDKNGRVRFLAVVGMLMKEAAAVGVV